MDAVAIVERLRAAGYLPVLVDDRIRLHGEVGRLPQTLREAIAANREALIACLRQTHQSVAFDLVEVAARAAWSPSVYGDEVVWWRGHEHTTNPMPTSALSAAMAQHHEGIVRVLRQVPPGCPVRPVCATLGICRREITASACTRRLTFSTDHSEDPGSPLDCRPTAPLNVIARTGE